MIRVNVFTLALLLVLSAVGAHTSVQTPAASPFKFTGPSGLEAAQILRIVLLLVLFVACTFLVFRKVAPNRGGGGAGMRRASAYRGLDPNVVRKFPTMVYAKVKVLRLGKGGASECVVCLTDFEDDDVLKLIPKCGHVFHPKCIGEWLGFHARCPFCQVDLVPTPLKDIIGPYISYCVFVLSILISLYVTILPVYHARAQRELF